MAPPTPTLAVTPPHRSPDDIASPDGPARDDDVVAALVERARDAHVALMKGDIERHRASIQLDGRFTLMSPMGGHSSRGNGYTPEEWAAIGRFFSNGRDSTFELIDAYQGADLVVLAAIEYAHVEVGGLPPQPWVLRVTLVFRRSGDRWLLAHRHADPLAATISVEQSAALAHGPAGY